MVRSHVAALMLVPILAVLTARDSGIAGAWRLNLEEDFGGGVKLLTRFTHTVSEELSRLEVTIKASGGPKPPPRPERDGEALRGPIDGVTRVSQPQER
jgi:hypothetical protein